MEDKKWLMADCNTRCTRAYLKALAQEVPASCRVSPYPAANKADLIAWIEKCRRNYWDQQQTSHTLWGSGMPPKEGRKRRVGSSLCKITASEVNAFLRTLPEGISYG
ncbi:hypothetical protein [Thalassovita sp.]|jgi:hypothetical protein|uniref:hypothetical protein n=1 Tax=Thalassovita sp. TaxID=1979401 RepID=UPI002AB0F820|nr:hypothetical protein [Thalassovita sp.]